MKYLLRLSMPLILACIVLAQVRLSAGEKKDKDKPENVVVNDALTTGDVKDKVRTGSYCKTYVFKMVEGKSYQIDMMSKDFDSYLRLEDPQGQQVAADDDGGGFPSARIIYRAAKPQSFPIRSGGLGSQSEALRVLCASAFLKKGMPYRL